jgi:hypothetical protein
MSSGGAARRATVPISNARAEASRKNGARSRGPKTLEGRARSSQNALKPGFCTVIWAGPNVGAKVSGLCG